MLLHTTRQSQIYYGVNDKNYLRAVFVLSFPTEPVFPTVAAALYCLSADRKKVPTILVVHCCIEAVCAGTLKYLEVKIEEWPSRAKWGQAGPNRAKWCQMVPNRVKRGHTGSNEAKKGQKGPTEPNGAKRAKRGQTRPNGVIWG